MTYSPLLYSLQNFIIKVGDNMEDIKINIGLRIKEIRKSKDLSQEKLANLVGLDRTYMTSVENGKRNVSIVNIKKICDGLEISLNDFFDSSYFEEEE